MLEKDDLPKDAKYYLPGPSWKSPHRNSEIISGWGKEKGQEYLEKTGRIDGWVVYYARGTSTVRAPEQIYPNIIQYEHCEGALITITEFSLASRNAELVVIYDDFDLGEAFHHVEITW